MISCLNYELMLLQIFINIYTVIPVKQYVYNYVPLIYLLLFLP
jgi:hypothetical protein